LAVFSLTSLRFPFSTTSLSNSLARNRLAALWTVQGQPHHCCQTGPDWCQLPANTANMSLQHSLVCQLGCYSSCVEACRNCDVLLLSFIQECNGTYLSPSSQVSSASRQKAASNTTRSSSDRNICMHHQHMPSIITDKAGHAMKTRTPAGLQHATNCLFETLVLTGTRRSTAPLLTTNGLGCTAVGAASLGAPSEGVRFTEPADATWTRASAAATWA
jgi:hypothetical protein